MITQEIIDRLNKVIEDAIDHGGDDGGPYFSCPDILYESLVGLLYILDPENTTEITNENYPRLKFKENK